MNFTTVSFNGFIVLQWPFQTYTSTCSCFYDDFYKSILSYIYDLAMNFTNIYFNIFIVLQGSLRTYTSTYLSLYNNLFSYKLWRRKLVYTSPGLSTWSSWREWPPSLLLRRHSRLPAHQPPLPSVSNITALPAPDTPPTHSTPQPPTGVLWGLKIAEVRNYTF